MGDPKKFKPYYVVEAFSKKVNKIQELHLATELSRMQRLDSLEIARARSKEFADSLNESKLLGTSDWEPLIQLQYTEKNKIPVN